MLKPSNPDETSNIYIINCKNGNLEMENQGDGLNIPNDSIEESKTLPKNFPEVNLTTNTFSGQNSLGGFIERDSAIGKIDISGFSLSVKGLTTEHEQKIDFRLSDWRLILNLFKYYNEPLKIMIGNYKASQQENISKRKLMKVLAKYVRHAESKLKNKDLDYKDYLIQKSSSKIVKKAEIGREEAKRYLFEIILPKVSVSYLHHSITRELSSDELEHLVNSAFINWKIFMIRSSFRMEFNINDPIPLKVTDKYLCEKERIAKRMKTKKLKIKQTKTSKPKSEDSRSQGLTAEEEEEAFRKNIIIKKAEVEKVQKAQKNIQFWFD